MEIPTTELSTWPRITLRGWDNGDVHALYSRTAVAPNEPTIMRGALVGKWLRMAGAWKMAVTSEIPRNVPTNAHSQTRGSGMGGCGVVRWPRRREMGPGRR
jgi:hypothetical protein